MKELESLKIQYIGYKEPSTSDELEFEILGLKTAISAAEQRIAVLAQSLKLAQMAKDTLKTEELNETSIAETPKVKETEQQS